VPRASLRATIVACVALVAACASVTYDTHDDLTISTQVKIALVDDARLGGFRINAATSHGVVTLEGTVPTQADVDHAIAVARGVRGVKDVKPGLKVGGSSQLSAFSCQLSAVSFQFGCWGARGWGWFTSFRF
jgi:hyperosmotically inducible periplasmic protein